MSSIHTGTMESILTRCIFVWYSACTIPCCQTLQPCETDIKMTSTLIILLFSSKQARWLLDSKHFESAREVIKFGLFTHSACFLYLLSLCFFIGLLNVQTSCSINGQAKMAKVLFQSSTIDNIQCSTILYLRSKNTCVKKTLVKVELLIQLPSSKSNKYRFRYGLECKTKNV